MKESGSIGLYQQFIVEVSGFISSTNLSYNHVKQLADTNTATVTWSSGGSNMTPLGSYELAHHFDSLVSNYRRAKICTSLPKPAKTVYEYHLNADGKCIASLLHNQDEHIPDWGPYYYEVYYYGRIASTDFYCCYHFSDDTERNPDYIYAYSQYINDIPALSLKYDQFTDQYELRADRIGADNIVLSSDEYNICPVKNTFPERDPLISEMMDNIASIYNQLLPKDHMETITINNNEYSVLHTEW